MAMVSSGLVLGGSCGGCAKVAGPRRISDKLSEEPKSTRGILSRVVIATDLSSSNSTNVWERLASIAFTGESAGSLAGASSLKTTGCWVYVSSIMLEFVWSLAAVADCVVKLMKSISLYGSLTYGSWHGWMACWGVYIATYFLGIRWSWEGNVP